MAHYTTWETVKKLQALGYSVNSREDGAFEIWMAWKLVATVSNSGGLYQFLLEENK